jgi:hypothetical protein
MVKEWPQANPRTTVVKISRPAGEWVEVELNDLLATCRREMSRRQFVYKKRIAEGKMSDEKAEAEIKGMADVVEFLVHCIFKAVTRRSKEQA